MSKDEMRRELAEYLAKFRMWSYDKLASHINSVRLGHFDATFSDGTYYQMSCDVFWDDEPDGNLRVIGDLCAEPQKRILINGSWGYTSDIADDFIMSPDGRFIGEEPVEVPSVRPS